METFFIRAAQLLLSLSILVLLHEFGHFLFARLFRVRVDKFYLFFNPTISLVRAKRINGKWQVKFFAKNIPANERPRVDADGHVLVDNKGRTLVEPIPIEELPDGDWRKYPENTEWGIGWLPLGGYCKIAGMIDESMDKAQMALPPKDWEYRSRPTWQRMPIIVGGVLVNFLLALVIYSAVLFTWGKEYLPFDAAKYGLHFSKSLTDAGLQNGDKVIRIDGTAIEQRADFVDAVLIDGQRNVIIERNGREVALVLPESIEKQILAAEELNLVSVRYPFVIGEVQPETPAAVAGLQAGDSIVAVGNQQVFIFQDVANALSLHKEKAVSIGFYRNGKADSVTVQLDENAKLGVSVLSADHFFETKKIDYGFWASIPAGIKLGWETLTGYVKQFKLVFTKEGASQLGGFGSIGKMFPQTWDWQVFWTMTALLSIILAFMNILPIPALDGGHVLFLIYEMLTGRKPSEKFMEYAQTFGFFLLMGLLLFANGNDIFRAIFK